MKVEDVARLTGHSPLTIRIGLRQGVFPFGVAIKTSEGSKNYTYVFFPEKVKEYLGEIGNRKEG